MTQIRCAAVRRLAPLSALLLACAVLVGGCIPIPLLGTSSSSSTTTPKGSKPATMTQPPALAMPGASRSAGPWRVTVVKALPAAKGPGGTKPASGKAFLLVDVEFKNVHTSDMLVVNPKDISLTSASGKKLSAVGTSPGYNARGMRAIAPGYGGYTTFVYQIPKGSHGYTFTFAPKVGSKRAKLQWGVP